MGMRATSILFVLFVFACGGKVADGEGSSSGSLGGGGGGGDEEPSASQSAERSPSSQPAAQTGGGPSRPSTPAADSSSPVRIGSAEGLSLFWTESDVLMGAALDRSGVRRIARGVVPTAIAIDASTRMIYWAD